MDSYFIYKFIFIIAFIPMKQLKMNYFAIVFYFTMFILMNELFNFNELH